MVPILNYSRSWSNSLICDFQILSLASARTLTSHSKSQIGIFQRSLPVLEESVNNLPNEPVRIYQASVFANVPGPDLVANTSGAIKAGILAIVLISNKTNLIIMK